jgi:hypothetical protein
VKNFVGALIGVIVGSFSIVYLIPIAQPTYPSPYDWLWVLLAGCNALQLTGQQLLALNNIHWYFISWIAIGIVASLFSDSKWNTVRTAFWVGVLITIFSLTSLLLLNPTFWTSETRNWELLIQFITSILTSFISLTSSIPLVIVILKIREQSDAPVPEKIESVCDCGAIFKSKPMICSECGRILHEQEPD